MHTGAGVLSAETSVRDEGAPGDVAATATFEGRLARVGPKAEGAVYLFFNVRSGTSTVAVKVPLSSTGMAYGEERSCTLSATGTPQMVFTAGLDDANSMPFRTAGASREFSISLNKYLCRVLAAPFRCGGRTVTLPLDLKSWTMAEDRGVELQSMSVVTLRATQVVVTPTGPFDMAQCRVIAPSEGTCCVGGRTTEWHCGGTPAGTGWHQVSGECFHRETGGSCKE